METLRRGLIALIDSCRLGCGNDPSVGCILTVRQWGNVTKQLAVVVPFS